MRHFFYILFGGIFAIAAGIGLAYFSGKVWNYADLGLANFSFSSVRNMATSFISRADDGTSISGISRTIRFSASEEEDLINSATVSLPADKKQITAQSYIVKNLDHSTTIDEREVNTIRPIASLTKLVTAAMAKKLLGPDSRITITREIISSYGNTADFRVGETFIASDLLYPLLMVSSNDAAEAFARTYGRKDFLNEMNNFVQTIGAYRTKFYDPSGLSPLNISTANDQAIILDWMRKNDPEIIQITDLKSKTVRSHTWENPTHFLNWSNYIGGKNGYTPEADRTGASLFTMGKSVYAVVVLGSSYRDGDVIKLLGRGQTYAESKN